MPKSCQMTGRGPAEQAVAMHCVRGRSNVTKAALLGPLCCILWAFSCAALLRADLKGTAWKSAFWRRPPSGPSHVCAHGRCNRHPVQPVTCQSTTQITALQYPPMASTNSVVTVRAATASYPSCFSRTPPCAEAMTHTR